MISGMCGVARRYLRLDMNVVDLDASETGRVGHLVIPPTWVGPPHVPPEGGEHESSNIISNIITTELPPTRKCRSGLGSTTGECKQDGEHASHPAIASLLTQGAGTVEQAR